MGRLDYLFHGKIFDDEGKINLDSLPSWPGWKDADHVPGLKQGLQMMKINGQDPATAARMDKCVIYSQCIYGLDRLLV